MAVPYLATFLHHWSVMFIVLVGDGMQQEELQQQQQQPPPSPRTPSTVKHDGLGYAIPNTGDKQLENYATVNNTRKKMSQRKKKETGGTRIDAEAVKSQSPLPPSPPPPIDPELVDEDIRHEPLIPPRLPQSEKLVEPNKSEPPYAKVNKGKVLGTEQASTTAETGGDGEVEAYASVDVTVICGVPTVQIAVNREYDTIDNVMSPTHHEPVNITLSEVEGDYATVRSDATILPICDHWRPDPGTDTVVATHNETPANTTAHRAHGETPIEHTMTISPEEQSEL